MARPPPAEKEQLVLTLQTSELLTRKIQLNRIACMSERTPRVIRIGRTERQPQQKPHQLKTMQQKAMNEAIPLVILAINNYKYLDRHK